MTSLNLRVMLCGIFWAVALAAPSSAADLALVSISQTKPGEVVARVSFVGAGGLQATELALRLDGDQVVPAASLVAVPAAAPASSALLLCLDRSGSMGAATVDAMQSALRDSLVPRDGAARLPFRVSIVAFGTGAELLLRLVDDPSLVAAAIAKLRVERKREGKTTLYDAVAGGLAQLRGTDASLKRLLVVSDGNDEGSAISRATLVQRISAQSIAVDAIGFGARAASSSGSLATLAGATGGRFTIAGTQAELASALKRMIGEAAGAAQFDVTFRYVAATDGRKSQASALLYKPRGGAPTVDLPTRANLAAVAAAVSASVPSPSPSPGSGSGLGPGPIPSPGPSSGPGPVPGPIPAPIADPWWKQLFGMPLLAWVLGGLLLLLVLVLVLAMLWLRNRNKNRNGVLPPPPPPPPATSLPPTMAPPPPPPAPSRGRRDTIVAFRWPLPGAGRTVAVLKVTSGNMRGRQFAVTTPRVRLGSTADNDFVLEGDDYVSGHHAAVRAENGGFYLMDLGSANGTDLNGSRFKNGSRSLSPHDRFTLGRTTIEVMTADAPPHGGDSGLEQRVR